MKRTLSEILERLPIVLRKRYSANFWVQTLNRIMQDVQFDFQLPELTESHGIFLENEIYDYEIPEFVRKVLGVYKLKYLEADTAGEFDQTQLSVDRVNDKLKWRQRGQWIEILEHLDASDDLIISEAMLENGSDKRKVVNSIDFVGEGLDFRGHLLQFITGENAGRSNIIAKHDSANGVVTLKRSFPNRIDFEGNPAYGELEDWFGITISISSESANSYLVEVLDNAVAGSETINWGPNKVTFGVQVGVSTVSQMLSGTVLGTPLGTLSNLRPNEVVIVDIEIQEKKIESLSNVVLGKTADKYKVGKYYVMIEYSKEYRTLDQVNCPVDVDHEMYAVIEDGLRYYGEYQTDEESEFTAKFKQMYEQSKRDYTAKKARGAFRPQPKFWN